MINEQLVSYIKTVQAQGFSESAIREVLAKAGWQNQDVDEAFSSFNLIKEMPLPVGMAYSQVTPVNNTNSPIGNNPNIRQPVSIEYNSPYSVGLAVVLCGAIFVLLNKIIDDSALFTNSINSKLIFDVLLIIPFLITAFILHESFHERRKRFLIISQPYFLVSGFLLIRLLWDTSRYILNTNATYGVYIVLILVIIVLTGSVLFIQKYIKDN